jgi:hypothetical protein
VANPTVQVQQTNTQYNNTEKYWPIQNTSTTYYPGEMIGKLATGYASHFDDTAAMVFLGIFQGPQFVVDSTVPNDALLVKVMRPQFFSMPAVSGTPSRLTDIGLPVYAKFSGTVQIGTSGLTFNNFVGTVDDIALTTGVSSTPRSLTGSTAMGWQIRTAFHGIENSGRVAVAAVTATGANQATANALIEGFNLVAGANGSLGVVLPTPSAGMQVVVKNNTSGQTLLVYPSLGTAINAVASNTNFNMASVTACLFIAYNATNWYTVPLVAS